MRKNPRRRSARGGLLATIVLLATMDGVAPAADRPVVNRKVVVTVARLDARADADSWAAAALLQAASDPSAALARATRAVEAAPGRPELRWLAIVLCQTAPACSSADSERQLHALDPANAAPHFAALRRAAAANDDEARQAALTAFAASERLTLYWTTLVAHGVRAITATGAMREADAERWMIGTLTPTIPPFGLLTHACQGDALDMASAKDRCRQIARVLQRGDSGIAEMVGVSIAKRVWAPASPEYRTADSARHVYDYRTRLLARHDAWMVLHPERYRTLLETCAREQDVLRQALVLLGLPPDPPSS